MSFSRSLHRTFKDISDRRSYIFKVSQNTCRIFASKVSTAILLSGAASLAHHGPQLLQLCRMAPTSSRPWCFWLARSRKLWSNRPFRTALTWDSAGWSKNSYHQGWQTRNRIYCHFSKLFLENEDAIPRTAVYFTTPHIWKQHFNM